MPNFLRFKSQGHKPRVGSDQVGLYADDEGVLQTVDSEGSVSPVGGEGGGSQPQAGAGSPVGVTTPSGIGGLYIDTTNGSIYIASGVTNADWVLVGGIVAGQIGETIGVAAVAGTLYMIGGVDPDTPLNGYGARLTDAYAQWNGNGSGLAIFGNGTDGQQKLSWTNDAGTFDLVSSAGSIGSPPGGILFPSSDPHINGAWWDNAGTLTKSSG